ncbi:DUF1376 domain-containing protein [uncultured Enterovirga sp.]|uniref:DUF1376 domain-containing protein n=1 Tax=uncultured Enterovirga sp. TaxID=2026352 RepID=UPI0035CA3814
MSDVRRLPYMPLQIERLRKSKAWLRCKREPHLAFYLMNLWMRAWHELPAGSIESDEDVLADAAMCDPDGWAAVRDDVMRGWDLRDGRYYHSTVTELAAEAATKLRGNSNRTVAAREALEAKRSQSSEATVTVSVTETVTGDEGKEREGKSSEPGGSGGEPPPAHDAEHDSWPSDPVERLWTEGVHLMRCMGVADREARSNIGRWTSDTGGSRPDDILAAIRRARDAGTRDPIPLVGRTLNPLNGHRHGNRDRQPSRADLRTAALADAFGVGDDEGLPTEDPVDRRSHHGAANGGLVHLGRPLRLAGSG